MGHKPLNSELNPICHLLALLGAHHILHVSRIRVKSLAPNDIYIYIYVCVCVCVCVCRTVSPLNGRTAIKVDRGGGVGGFISGAKGLRGI